MHRKSLILASILLAATAYAKEPKTYQDGKLLQMDSVQCGTDTKDAKKGKTHELLCQEYVVQTDQVLYRIRPKDDKHSTLLAIGQNTQFHFEKNKMLLRVEGADGKEREYVIMSIKPRGESTADASPAHLNHLQ
ncbi:MAG: hypothetical protein WB762_33690 [Candidatus Sulfotelmatobacter sp.]